MSNETFRNGAATVNFIPENQHLLKARQGYSQDRGTKLIKYLAEVKVNGHPDVKEVIRIKYLENHWCHKFHKLNFLKEPRIY